MEFSSLKHLLRSLINLIRRIISRRHKADTSERRVWSIICASSVLPVSSCASSADRYTELCVVEEDVGEVTLTALYTLHFW